MKTPSEIYDEVYQRMSAQGASDKEIAVEYGRELTEYIMLEFGCVYFDNGEMYYEVDKQGLDQFIHTPPKPPVL